MAGIDPLLFAVSATFYFGAIGVFGWALISGSEKAGDIAVVVIKVGLVFHTTSLLLRWYYSGHMPGDNIYELNAVGAWITVILYLVCQHFYKRVRIIGVVVLALSLAMMLYGFSKPHGFGPLSDEYQSPWFYVHILSAFLGYSCYVIATSAAIFVLVAEGKPKILSFAGERGSIELFSDINNRFVAYGFVCHAVMLTSGSVWANTAWGRYWSWDPVETWSLITWLIYGFHLHARSFMGWSARRLAWVSIIALIAIVFNFWGISHMPMGEMGMVDK